VPQRILPFGELPPPTFPLERRFLLDAVSGDFVSRVRRTRGVFLILGTSYEVFRGSITFFKSPLVPLPRFSFPSLCRAGFQEIRDLMFGLSWKVHGCIGLRARIAEKGCVNPGFNLILLTSGFLFITPRSLPVIFSLPFTKAESLFRLPPNFALFSPGAELPPWDLPLKGFLISFPSVWERSPPHSLS